jgi:hypothetical protein
MVLERLNIKQNVQVNTNLVENVKGINLRFYTLLHKHKLYLGWLTISSWGYHPPSSQCFCIDIFFLDISIFEIYSF